MKSPLLVGALALLAFSTIGTAGAADMPARMGVYKAPAAAGSWDGFYAGVGLGARWADPDWTTTSNILPTVISQTVWPNSNVSFSNSALRLSGYAGYNWQVAPTWVLGLEADIGWADNRDTYTAGIPGFGIGPVLNSGSFAEVKATWDASLRARAGYLITPQVLAYATGGVAFQHLEAIATCPADGNVCNPAQGTQSLSNSSDRVGWTIGGGLETKLAQNWLARVEYRYSDFGNYSFTILPVNGTTNFTGNATLSMKTQIVTVGLAYKFGSY